MSQFLLPGFYTVLSGVVVSGPHQDEPTPEDGAYVIESPSPNGLFFDGSIPAVVIPVTEPATDPAPVPAAVLAEVPDAVDPAPTEEGGGQ